MKNIRPSNLVLRCYAHPIENGKWYGVCLELNLSAEAESVEQIQKQIKEIIVSYIETVVDTDDYQSVSRLLNRKAPIDKWLKYYWIKTKLYIKHLSNSSVFDEIIPFSLGSKQHC